MNRRPVALSGSLEEHLLERRKEALEEWAFAHFHPGIGRETPVQPDEPSEMEMARGMAVNIAHAQREDQEHWEGRFRAGSTPTPADPIGEFAALAELERLQRQRCLDLEVAMATLDESCRPNPASQICQARLWTTDDHAIFCIRGQDVPHVEHIGAGYRWRTV